MPVYHDLTTSNLIQNWDPGTITSSDVWPADLSIIGYLGDIYPTTAPTDLDPRNLRSPALGAVDVVANQTTGNPSSGGVIEVTVGGNTMVGLNGSGTADAPSLVLYLNAAGREQVTVSFDAIDADASADFASQQLNIQYRTSATGEWINVPGGYFADVSATGGVLTTPISVTLPSGANNAATLEVRIMTVNAGGNDEFIGIDNIVVGSRPLTATPANPGALSIDDVSVVEGNDGTTDMTFTVTRANGSDGSVSAIWSVAHGTTEAADFAGATSGTVLFAAGETSRTITIRVAGDLAVEPTETFRVLLSDPQGEATITDGSGAGTITADDLPPIANVWINEFHYDPSSSPETGEFVEIAGQAGIDLTGYRIVLYNGGNGTPYAPTGGSAAGISLSGTLSNSANGFGFASVLSPGLQNGSPDAIALVDNFGRVVQFISYEGAMTAVSGPAAGITSTDIGRFEDQATPGTSLQLSGTGSSYADFTWTFGRTSTAGGSNAGQTFLSGTDQGQIRIGNTSVVEGDSGQSMLVFTLHRAGGFATEASVGYTIGFGTADAGDLAAGTPLSGTVTFAPGELTQTIRIPVTGDVSPEYNEWIFVDLGAVTGNAVVVDPAGIGTILNDDPIALTIMQIQGEAHTSEFNGQPVISRGIVTAIAANGFYMQDPDGDGNARTSDALFVFTGGAPAVAVGDAVQVTGRASEFGSELTTTQISITGNAAFGVTVLSQNNELPDAVLVGTGGLTPPTESIDSDGLTIFNPESDGIDFWESLEGMLVSLDRPQVVANSNSATGETYVIASRGEGATGVNGDGGITISTGDYNPEMIQLDDSLLGGSGYVAGHSVGDQLGTVTGIVGYSFARFELLLTDVPSTTVDVTLEREVVEFAGDANYMTFATFNVENLGPEDGSYDELATDIVQHLLLPDVIAIQEMQDNDGTGRGSDLSAAANAQGLINAIHALSGITYAYVEVAPATANSTGGEANGNIRNGYLYRVDRVDLVEGSVQLINDPSFANSRAPLVATWSFQGTEVTTVNVHFTARSGSDPLWGANQPPENAGDARRTDQAGAVNEWLNAHLADDPSFNAMVLGDWNGFYFEDALQLDGFVNLQVALLPEAERYSYVFEGNAQLLDNILVSSGLFPGAGVDGVHINAYFGDAATSDHDPQVARLLLGTRPTDIVIDNASVAENLPAGAVVGTVSATDAPGDRLRFSLADDAGGRFAINAATGVITTLVALNHEALAAADILVRVTDSAGQSTDQSISITIDDVNETPVTLEDGVAVDEDGSTGNLWTQLLGNDSDPDAGDTLTISAVGTSGTLGRILFDAAAQTLRYVADHDSFDALAPGATATDTFTYTVTDSGGLSRTETVTMTVTGIADGVTRHGGNGSDQLSGTGGEDRLFGDNGDDQLSGGEGHDLLDGGRGNDALVGGIGNDVLIGGAGNDMLNGGAGGDLFVFGRSSGSDTILDFNRLKDTLRLTDGQSIRGSRTADLNSDGIADLVIDLHGGSLTLLGVGSIEDVSIDYAAQSPALDPFTQLTIDYARVGATSIIA